MWSQKAAFFQEKIVLLYILKEYKNIYKLVKMIELHFIVQHFFVKNRQN